MFNSKTNFENYINEINGYIQMLADCKKDKIDNFIAKSEQEKSKIVETEIQLTNQQIDATDNLSTARQEREKLRQTSNAEIEIGKEELAQNEKRISALQKEVDKSQQATNEAENELTISQQTAAQNGTTVDNTTALKEQQIKVDALKQEEQDILKKLELEKIEIEKKRESIVQREEAAKAQMETIEKKSAQFEEEIKNNKAEILKLKTQNDEMNLQNSKDLEEKQKLLEIKNARIKEIEEQLTTENIKAKGVLKANSDDIERIKIEKEGIEHEKEGLEKKLITLEEEKKDNKEKLENLEKKLQTDKQVDEDEKKELTNELSELKYKLEKKEKEKVLHETNKKEMIKAVKDLADNLQAKDNDIVNKNNELESLKQLKSKIEEEKTKLNQDLLILRKTTVQNDELEAKYKAITETNDNLQKTIDKRDENERKLQKEIDKLRDKDANNKASIEAKLREEFNAQNQKYVNEIKQLQETQFTQMQQPQLIQDNKFIDKYIYSGFSLRFPSTQDTKFIELEDNESNKRVTLCTNKNFVTNTDNNKNYYDYLIKNVGKIKFAVTGVNNYKFNYRENKIYEIKSNKSDESLKLELAITPLDITPLEFKTLLQATDMDKCIKLEFTEIKEDGKKVKGKEPIIVFVQPLPQSNEPPLLRGGWGWGSKKKNPEEIQYNNEKVIPMAQFKMIKESIDTIITKVKEYEKKLVKEKKGNIKHKTKLSKIKELIKLSGKINILYEGSSTEKFKSLFTKNKPNPSTGGALFGLGKKRATNPMLPGEQRAKVPPSMDILRLAAAKQGQGDMAKEYKENILDEQNRDKGSKSLTKEKCMKIKKYLENFNEILKSLQNDTGDESLEKLKTDTANAVANSENPQNSGKNSLINKMMDVQKKFKGTSSDSKPNNSTEILTITTMIIYDILLVSIVIICIIIYILFVINIIKFLYQCFLEVGNSQHNNLATGRTLRYKLLGYVVYINNCNLPSLFSSFNSVDTPSGTFMRLSKVLEKYFTNERNQVDTDTFESIFGELSDKVAIPKTPQKIAEEKHDKWLTEEGKDASPEAQEQHKATLTKQEIENDQERKNTQYEENKNYKEPKFNIFLCIRLVFICIKLFITFITIIVISIITFILLSVVSQMANMDAIEISIIKKQKLFFMLLQLLAVSIMHIIIKLIIYKTMFVKIYNKYLNTYLNIIAIDLTINSLKKLDKLEYIDRELAIRLKNSVDNNSYIEERLIQLMNQLGSDDSMNETIIKYITIYMLLKYLYSYEKNKSNYLLYYSYFINDGDYSLPSELNMEKNNITTFYSLIPNKHRKTPIDYFKYSDIKNILDIENAEKIRQGVNTYISQINTYIADANSYFDDDNFIVSLGWYILINIILGTIYIIIIVTIILNETEIMKGNFNLYEFTKFE